MSKCPICNEVIQSRVMFNVLKTYHCKKCNSELSIGPGWFVIMLVIFIRYLFLPKEFAENLALDMLFEFGCFGIMLLFVYSVQIVIGLVQVSVIESEIDDNN